MILTIDKLGLYDATQTGVRISDVDLAMPASLDKQRVCRYRSGESVGGKRNYFFCQIVPNSVYFVKGGTNDT